MSFDDAGAAADQEFSLVRDTDGTVQYKTKVAEGTLLNFSDAVFLRWSLFPRCIT